MGDAARKVFRDAVRAARGDVGALAEALGCSRRAVFRRLAAAGLNERAAELRGTQRGRHKRYQPSTGVDGTDPAPDE